MRNVKKLLCVILSVMMLASSLVIGVCAAAPEEGAKGTLKVMSYDLQSMRALDDAAFTAGDVSEAGSIINALGYDIIATQEDYDIDWSDYPVPVEVYDYHDLFTAQMKNYADIYEDDTIIDTILGTDPDAVERHQTVPAGDGLSIYSTYAIYNTDRQSWKTSSNTLSDGSKCLYDTGFVVTTIELDEGYFLDIYNVSMDEYEGSVSERQAQFKQLADYIKRNSIYDEELDVYEHAVIVTGNFNASVCQENDVYDYDGLIANLLEGAALNDAWAVTTINNISEEPDDYSAYYDYALRTTLTSEQAFGHYDSGERILYADGNGIDLSCVDFSYAQINGLIGTSLSDHKAAIAQISFEIVEKTYEYGNESNEKEVEQEQSWLIKFLNSIAEMFKAIGYFFQNLFS